MFERGVCIFVAIISLFGVFYSSKNMDVYSDVSYAARSNYVDVYFTDVESSNGSKVSLSPSRRSLQMDSISLSRAGEEEVIRYELFNNSYSYDVFVDVTINGEKYYENEFFTMECSSIGEVKSGQRVQGEIKVTLKKAVIENISVPFDVEMNVTPIQKGYLN